MKKNTVATTKKAQTTKKAGNATIKSKAANKTTAVKSKSAAAKKTDVKKTPAKNAGAAAEKAKKEKAAEKLRKEKAAEKLRKEKAAEKLRKEKAAEKLRKEKAAEKLRKEKAAEKLRKEKAEAKAKKEKAAQIAALELAAAKVKKEKAAKKGALELDAAKAKKEKSAYDDDLFAEAEAETEDGELEPFNEEKQQLFDKKIKDLLRLARQKKNVLDLAEIEDVFAEMSLSAPQMDLVLEKMEQSGVDVFRTANPEEDLPDNDDLIMTEEVQDLENIDLTLPEGVNTDDPVRMYLKEIGKVPLLTGDQEVVFAKQIEAGVAADRVLYADKRKNKLKYVEADKEQNKDKAKDAEESEAERMKREAALVKNKTRKQLLEMSEIGKIASSRLAEANLRLVVSIAKRYVGRGLLFLDLIQEGNLGLIKAVEKFDYRKGFKFSTYATWWIRQAITRAIADQARTIRIPVHMVETINKLVRTSRTLLQELGREPTPEEIAKEMGIDVNKVRDIQKISQEPVSLETPIGEEEDSHLGDFLMDDKVPVPIEAASFTLLKEQLMEVLHTLTEREQKVLRLRFGLDDGRARTLEEVGREFNVTRERIRQIEAKALRKLRHPSRSKKLKDYLD